MGNEIKGCCVHGGVRYDMCFVSLGIFNADVQQAGEMVNVCLSLK